jgi:hypothetical protein
MGRRWRSVWGEANGGECTFVDGPYLLHAMAIISPLAVFLVLHPLHHNASFILHLCCLIGRLLPPASCNPVDIRCTVLTLNPVWTVKYFVQFMIKFLSSWIFFSAETQQLVSTVSLVSLTYPGLRSVAQVMQPGGDVCHRSMKIIDFPCCGHTACLSCPKALDVSELHVVRILYKVCYRLSVAVINGGPLYTLFRAKLLLLLLLLLFALLVIITERNCVS